MSLAHAGLFAFLASTRSANHQSVINDFFHRGRLISITFRPASCSSVAVPERLIHRRTASYHALSDHTPINSLPSRSSKSTAVFWYPSSQLARLAVIQALK